MIKIEVSVTRGKAPKQMHSLQRVLNECRTGKGRERGRKRLTKSMAELKLKGKCTNFQSHSLNLKF